MKRTLLASILATAAIAFSCTVEEPGKSDSVVFNPTATVADFVLDGATKTSFTISDNKASFAFNDDDILRIYPLNPVGDGIRFTVKDNKGTSCVFDGGGFGLFNGLSYAAFYPGSDEVVPDATEIPVNYTGQAMAAIDEYDLSKVDYLVASVPAVEGSCSFSMKHIGALMVMDVTFEEGGTYTELSLTSDNAPFITEGIVDLTADEISIEPEGTSATITLALGGPDGIYVESGETVRFIMMIAPVDMSESTILMELKNGEDVISTEFEGKNYEAGKAFKVIGSPVGPEEPLGDPIDLSENETANTYIVSERGYYSFNATIAGNGKKVTWDTGHAASAYPEYNARTGVKKFSGDGVVVTLNQNNCVSNVSFEDGRILFKATGKEGNAKLTLTKAGEYVWTWVIWCTDTPAVLPFTYEGITYNLMDRNLGAISDGSDATSIDDVAGLYYQFGNPLGYTWKEFENGILEASRNMGATMKSALADNPNAPNMNVTGTPASTGATADWYWFWVYNSSKANSLMGKLWGAGSTFNDDLLCGFENSKTLYDPCPAGYKVMGWDTFLEYNDVDYANAFGVYVPVDGGAELFIPYNGFAFSNQFGPFWAGRGPYPVTIDGVGGPYATLWTSGANGRNVGYAFGWKATGATSGQRSTDAMSDGTSHIVARGLGVRCILDEFGE